MKTRRLITYKQLKPEKGIPFSRTHLSRLMKAKKFPQQVQVSDNTVAWFEDEIDDHVAEKAAARDQ
jgi:prophage regulatory protein